MKYTATMRYVFKSGSFKEGCSLWESLVLKKAEEAHGLVRMQFLTAEPQALAVGTWKDKRDAETFMQTGVFKVLMEQLKPLLAEEPKSEQWELRYFAGK